MGGGQLRHLMRPVHLLQNQNSMANQCNLWIFFSSSVVKMIANIISSQICSTKEVHSLCYFVVNLSFFFFTSCIL